MSIWEFCFNCHVGQCIGIGYNVEFVSEKRKREMLKEIGWQIVPVKLCPDCKPKMKCPKPKRI